MNSSDCDVRCLVIDPNNPQILYASTYGYGVWKSRDGGASWFDSSNGMTSSFVGLIIIDPSNSRTLYAGFDDGEVCKSTNGGESWIASSGSMKSPVCCLAIDPGNSQVVYAGTYEGGVWKSSDGGASWTTSSTGLIYSDVYSLAIDPGNSQVVYAGACDVVFKSTSDETASSTGLKNSHVVGMDIGVGVVCKSSNGGASWAAFSSGLPNSPVSVAIDSSGILYAVTANGVFRMAPEQ
jgi:photosystem II stability/assembly factor-like uncharacterized protein